MKTIKITKRGDIFIAEWSGFKRKGTTPSEAVCHMLNSYTESFGVLLRWNDTDEETERYRDK